MINERIFRAYDIRGKVGPDLNKEIAYHIGKVFAALAITENNKNICVGFDGRLSSAELFQGLVLGLIDGGANIINIGLVASPILYFADKKLMPAASIMITGSHNPKSDNGFKMRVQGSSYHGEHIQYLKAKVMECFKQNPNPKLDRLAQVESQDFYEDYINRIIEGMNLSSTLKIVWDNSNGSAGKALELLVKKLPNQNILLNKEIDGDFPNHHPDPTVAENLKGLINVVKQEQYDLGIAFDGDGDRIGVVDSRGNIILGDQLFTIFTEDLLKSNPNAAVVFDIKVSNALFKFISSLSGRPYISKVGHGFIKEKMKETGALLGGEMSGHIFFADKYYGFDDAIYAAVRLIDLLNRSKISLDTLYDNLPKTCATPEIRIQVAEEQKFAIVDEIKHALQGLSNIIVNDIDGVRVESQSGWWLLRASNTEAMLNIRCEAESLRGLEEIKNQVNNMLAKFNLQI
jgi:phosphomannomutase